MNHVKRKSINKTHESPRKKVKSYFCKELALRKNSSSEKEVNLNYQQKIMMNIFKKGESQFYSNRITLVEVLRKIFYKQFRYDQLVEQIIHCFKRVPNLRKFLETLIHESKTFSLHVKHKIYAQIEKVGAEQIELRFSKDMLKYHRIIGELHEWYKHLEGTNQEIEQLIQSYLKNNLKANQEELQEILSLNRKIFVDCIFKEHSV